MKQFFTTGIFLLLVLGLQAQSAVMDTLFSLSDHTRTINKAIYSMDGRRLVSCGVDRTVNIYESINWIPMGSYQHADEVTHVAISRDNSYVASVSKDNSIKVWNLDSGMIVFECKGQAGVTTGLVIDMGVRFIYTSSEDGNIRIFDIKKRGELTKTIAAGLSISSLAVSHTGNIYAGMKNGEIRVTNMMGKFGKPIKAHTAEVTHLHYVFYQPKGLAFLASASEDKTAKIWDLKTSKEFKVLKGHTWRVNHVELSRDLKYVLTASNDGFIKIWDVNTGKELASIDKKGNVANCVSINGDNTNIATISPTGSDSHDVVYIWDPKLVVETKPPGKPVPGKTPIKKP